MRPVASDQLRRVNTALVLRSLREQGPGSRATLAQRTGLAKATVGTIVGALAEAGVLVEGDLAEPAGRGRPSRPVSLGPAAVLGLGLEVNVDYAAAALVDLAGTVVLTRTAEVEAGQDPLAVTSRLAADVLADSTGHVVGAHLAVPGLVERDHATVAWAPNLGWEGTRPGETLSAAVGLPVLVDNDANLAAVAESAHGAARDASSSLYITGTVGIGGGIVQDGRLVRGGGFAGEVGHMPIGDQQRRCGCGRHGCWEASVGLRATLAAVGLPDGGTPTESARRVAEHATSSASAGAALAVLGERLGHGIATLGTVLDPDVVVLGGYFEQLAPWILGPAQEVVDRRLPAADRHRPQVRVGALGIAAAATGAAEQALADLLDGSVALDLGDLAITPR